MKYVKTSVVLTLITALIGLALVSVHGKTASPSAHAQEISEGDSAGTDFSSNSGVSLNLRDYMVHVIEYNAFDIWNRQAFISNEDGSHSTLPTNEEEWEEAESAALTLVQLTYRLQSPELYPQDNEWVAGVERLRAVAQEAAAAGFERDPQRFAATGDALDKACVSCHYTFAPHLEDPALRPYYMEDAPE